MRYTKKGKHRSYKHIHVQFCQNKGFKSCHSIGSLIIFSDKSPSGRQFARVSYFLLDEYPTRVGNLNGSYNKVLDWRVTDIYLFHTTFKKIVENRYRIQVKGSKKSCYWNGSYLLQHCDGGCFEWDRKSNGRQPRICSGALQRAAPKWWQMQMRQGSWGSANKFQMVWSIKKFFLQSFKN